MVCPLSPYSNIHYLASNMLDVPNFFWDSEPTLHPLYYAVREYLEIKPRIQVLNERCRVFLDLAEILSDSIADNKMSRKYFPLFLLFSLFSTTIFFLHSLLPPSKKKQMKLIQIIIVTLLSRTHLDHHRPHPPLHRRHLL